MKSPIRLLKSPLRKKKVREPAASYYAHPRLSSSSLTPPNFSSLAADDADQDAGDESKPKLVWALHGAQTWWPALLYASLDDLENSVSPSLYIKDPESYQNFQMHVGALKRFNKGLKNEAVVFLGRPLGDFRLVHDKKSYKRFFGKQMKRMHAAVICKPKVFSMDKKEYFAFHMGLDEAMKRAEMKEKLEEGFWAKKAFEAWASATRS